MTRTALAAALLVVGAATAIAGEPISDEGWLLVTELELAADPDPADPAGEWARFDVPPVLHVFLIDGLDDLRLVDGAGNEVERLLIADGGVLAPREVELSAFGNEPGEIRVVLPGPGDAPDALLLAGVAAGTEVTVEGALEPDDWRPIGTSVAGARGRVELPPFCARLLRVRAAGVERATGHWHELRPSRGAALAPPRVHEKTWRDGLLRLEIDLGVRKAPELEVEIDLAATPNGSVRGFSVPFPSVDFGERMVWAPDAAAPAGRVRGRFTAVARGQRYVRVEVPTADPGDPNAVRVVRLAASVTRHRVFFRRRGVVEPVRLLVGKSGVGTPDQPLTRAATAFDIGRPATFEPPDWRFLRGPRPAHEQIVETGRGERPFPWAEVVATALFAALVAASLIVRRLPR